MKTARSRVHGIGPKRHELRTFARIGTLSSSLVDELDNLAHTTIRNDLGGDQYTLPSSFDLVGTFNAVPESYRQILLQKSIDPSPSSETAYAVWEPKFEDLQTELQRSFSSVYRFRLSVSKAQHSIPWHIDTDTSVSCRAQICLSPSGVFSFKTKNGIEELKMVRGEMYFVNTGFNHSVQVGTEERRVCIFGFQFHDAAPSIQAIIRI